MSNPQASNPQREMFRPTKNSKFYRARLKIEPFSEQKVDIIVPFHAKYEKLATLIHSLIYQTRSNPFRVCIVDDASPNDIFFQSAFEAFPNILTIRNETQLGFGASLEIGAKALAQHGAFPWLVFLHSDVIIEDPNWLLNMGQTMLNLKSQGVKLVSATTNNPTVNNPLLSAKKNEHREDVILESDYLPLYCALCHRELFNKIQGFVKPYPYAGYEDIELAARMKKYGFKQAVSGKAWVYHEGAATIDYLTNKEPLIFEQILGNVKLLEEDLKKLA